MPKSDYVQIRDKNTNSQQFRQITSELSRHLMYEATKDCRSSTKDISTPLGPAKGSHLTENLGLFPILRAGLGMIEGALSLLPDAPVWHIGLYRDEESLQPIVYYNKLPKPLHIDIGYVLDPMLATAGSAIATVHALKKNGIKQCKFIGLIAAPEGIRALQNEHPDVEIYVGMIDSHLNQNSYIVPGLGDAGDRLFATTIHRNQARNDS